MKKRYICVLFIFLMLLIVDSPCAEPIDIRPHSWRMLVHSSTSQLERLSFSTLFLHITIYCTNRIVFYIIFYCTFILFMVLFRTNSVFYACVCGIFVWLLLYHYYFAHFSPACFYYPPKKSKSLFIVIRLKFVYCTFLSILFLWAIQHIIIWVLFICIYICVCIYTYISQEGVEWEH